MSTISDIFVETDNVASALEVGDSGLLVEATLTTMDTPQSGTIQILDATGTTVVASIFIGASNFTNNNDGTWSISADFGFDTSTYPDGNYQVSI